MNDVLEFRGFSPLLSVWLKKVEPFRSFFARPYMPLLGRRKHFSFVTQLTFMPRHGQVFRLGFND